MGFGLEGLDDFSVSAPLIGFGPSIHPLSPSSSQYYYYNNKAFSRSGLVRNQRSEDDRASKESKSCDFESATMLSFSGYGSGGLNAGACFVNGVKGPFTPSQWLELEHQALIYKHFMSNEPIPPNLLFPIRKALESARISSFTGDPLRHNPFGWGAFHLGFSNGADPEPGRCRRTDGKKWRCTRDAVVDQKYCERHINRGRHRSRKPVEGQNGNSVVSVAATSSIASTTKSVPMVSSSSVSMTCGGATDSFNIGNQRFKNWPLGASDTPASPFVNRMLGANNPGVQATTTRTSFLPSDIGLNMRENMFPPPKHPGARYDFGGRSTESVLSSSQKSNPSCGSYASSPDSNNPQSEVQNPLLQAIVARAGTPWPESYRSNQSTSMPMLPLDFMSSTSSPITASPSQENGMVQMGLVVGNYSSASYPISWDNSLGGPLGEVLHSTKGSLGEHRDIPGLDLLSKNWDRSPQLSSSSPTGVLQKNAYGSL